MPRRSALALAPILVPFGAYELPCVLVGDRPRFLVAGCCDRLGVDRRGERRSIARHDVPGLSYERITGPAGRACRVRCIDLPGLLDWRPGLAADPAAAVVALRRHLHGADPAAEADLRRSRAALEAACRRFAAQGHPTGAARLLCHLATAFERLRWRGLGPDADRGWSARDCRILAALLDDLLEAAGFQPQLLPFAPASGPPRPRPAAAGATEPLVLPIAAGRRRAAGREGRGLAALEAALARVPGFEEEASLIVRFVGGFLRTRRRSAAGGRRFAAALEDALGRPLVDPEDLGDGLEAMAARLETDPPDAAAEWDDDRAAMTDDPANAAAWAEHLARLETRRRAAMDRWCDDMRWWFCAGRTSPGAIPMPGPTCRCRRRGGWSRRWSTDTRGPPARTPSRSGRSWAWRWPASRAWPSRRGRRRARRCWSWPGGAGG